jgi:hypothetical protein
MGEGLHCCQLTPSNTLVRVNCLESTDRALIMHMSKLVVLADTGD